MKNDSTKNQFLLSTFISEIDHSSLPKEKSDLIISIGNLHSTHLQSHVNSRLALNDLYKTIIYILQKSIDEGSTSKESKNILEKLKFLASKNEEMININLDEYNAASINLIESLKKIGI